MFLHNSSWFIGRSRTVGLTTIWRNGMISPINVWKIKIPHDNDVLCRPYLSYSPVLIKLGLVHLIETFVQADGRK